MMNFWMKKLTQGQLIAIGFLLIILAGTGLLMLPVSSVPKQMTPFLDALFTATSAACVTGLVIRDTAQSWSVFGQAVILLLIQIGGLGFMTVGVFFCDFITQKDRVENSRDSSGKHQYFANWWDRAAGKTYSDWDRFF